MDKIQKYVVGYLFSSDKNKVALIKKVNCSDEQKWQEGCLNGIGGKIAIVPYTGDVGRNYPSVRVEETPEQAMRREFKEEAGVDIPGDNWELFLTVDKPSNDSGNPITLYMFKCFSTERLQQARTCSTEGEVSIYEVATLPLYPVVDVSRIFLALEDRKFKMLEITTGEN